MLSVPGGSRPGSRILGTLTKQLAPAWLRIPEGSLCPPCREWPLALGPAILTKGQWPQPGQGLGQLHLHTHLGGLSGGDTPAETFSSRGCLAAEGGPQGWPPARGDPWPWLCALLETLGMTASQGTVPASSKAQRPGASRHLISPVPTPVFHPKPGSPGRPQPSPTLSSLTLPRPHMTFMRCPLQMPTKAGPVGLFPGQPGSRSRAGAQG